MKTRDPTAKQNLIKATRTHQRITRHNTPGAIPAITRTRDIPAVISQNNRTQDTRQKSTRVRTQTMYPTINCMPGPIIIPPYPVPENTGECKVSQPTSTKCDDNAQSN